MYLILNTAISTGPTQLPSDRSITDTPVPIPSNDTRAMPRYKSDDDSSIAAAAAPARRPNVIFTLVDDCAFPGPALDIICISSTVAVTRGARRTRLEWRDRSPSMGRGRRRAPLLRIRGPAPLPSTALGSRLDTTAWCAKEAPPILCTMRMNGAGRA